MTNISYLNTDNNGKLWSPITGCSGKGCTTKETCWARDMVKKRFPAIHGIELGIGGSWAKGDLQPERIPFSQVVFHLDRLNQPLHWKKPRRIGVCFMGDLFDDQVKDEWIIQVFNAMHPDMMQPLPHTYFVLTKQSKRMREFFEKYASKGPVPWSNPYFGVSCTSQADANRMIPDLLRIPGKHWLSLEPMMEEIKLPPYIQFGYRPKGVTAYPQQLGMDGPPPPSPGVQWIVLGSHNNPRRYPFKLEWAESIIEACLRAGVKLYIKQIPIAGKCNRNIEEWPEHLRVREI